MLKELIVITLGLAAIVLLVGCESAPTSLPAPAAPAAPAAPKPPPAPGVGVGPFSKPGFRTFDEGTRVVVFRLGDKQMAAYQQSGKLAGEVTDPNGPAGLTLAAANPDTLKEFQMSNKDFVLRLDNGRLWVFRSGSADLVNLIRYGELAKHVTRVGGGPGGVTIKSGDYETIDAYLASLKE